MEKQKKVVTFDTLIAEDNTISPSQSTQKELTTNTPNKTLDNIDQPLANEHFWKNENFTKIFYKRKNRFSSNDNEIKEEFLSWHKEIGNKHYNKTTGEFQLKNLNFPQTRLAYSEILHYINLHPLLTIKDKKILKIVKNEVNDKLKNFLMMNTLFAFGVSYSFIFFKARRDKIAVNKVAKENFIRVLFLFTISVIYIDLKFKLKKPYILVDKLCDSNFDEKYFKSYL